ncbi:MAG: antitoxin [Acidobacteria bacterium]|nr:antitoxin [Acidobacteriota bacterium]
MTLTLPLDRKTEAKLVALARERGISADELVREAIARMLESASDKVRPKKSAFGLLEKFGPGPSEEEIDESRKEMFRGFAEDRP